MDVPDVLPGSLHVGVGSSAGSELSLSGGELRWGRHEATDASCELACLRLCRGNRMLAAESWALGRLNKRFWWVPEPLGKRITMIMHWFPLFSYVHWSGLFLLCPLIGRCHLCSLLQWFALFSYAHFHPPQNHWVSVSQSQLSMLSLPLFLFALQHSLDLRFVLVVSSPVCVRCIPSSLEQNQVFQLQFFKGHP